MEKPLWMIYATHMFIEIFLLMQVALIPVIIKEFQLSLLEASLVATVPSFAALLMNIPSGILADRLQANHLLFASMVMEGISAFLVSQTSSFWVLVLAASLLRVSSPVYHISGLSQISRLVKPERLSRSIGFHNALGSLGSAVGVFSLTLFLSTLGWRWTYLFWSVPTLAWSLIVLTSPQLKVKHVEKATTHGGNELKRLYLVFSSMMFFMIIIGVREIGNTGSITFMTTYFVQARGLPETLASLIFGLGPVIGIFGSLWGGYMAERFSAKKALSLVVLCSALTLCLLAWASTINLILPLYILYSFFGSAVWSPINTMVASLAPFTERGLSYSVYFLTEGLLISLAPTLAATVIESTSIWFVLPFCMIFLITSVVMLQFLPSARALAASG